MGRRLEATLLTLESTVAAVLACEGAGKVKRFSHPLRGREREVRLLSMSTHVLEWLASGSGRLNDKARSISHFRDWITGEEFYDGADIKRVENPSRPDRAFADEVWAMRPNFQPGIRFFGAFLTPDWFFISHFTDRIKLQTEADWIKQIEKTNSKWLNLLGRMEKLSAATLQEYITYNAEHTDDRW